MGWFICYSMRAVVRSLLEPSLRWRVTANCLSRWHLLLSWPSIDDPSESLVPYRRWNVTYGLAIVLLGLWCSSEVVFVLKTFWQTRVSLTYFPSILLWQRFELRFSDLLQGGSPVPESERHLVNHHHHYSPLLHWLGALSQTQNWISAPWRYRFFDSEMSRYSP